LNYLEFFTYQYFEKQKKKNAGQKAKATDEFRQIMENDKNEQEL